MTHKTGYTGGQCAKRASLHAPRRDRVREVHMAVVLMLLQTLQHLLHLCWCASLVPGHSEGGKTLQDTSARQLGHAFLVRFRQMLFDLSLPLRGRKASPVPGGFLSRSRSRCVCVCVCVHVDNVFNLYLYFSCSAII